MILLNRAYGGYATNTIVQLPKDTEDALIAQGLAVTSAGPVTQGAVSTSYQTGRVTVAIGAASVVVTNASCNISSQAFAVVSTRSSGRHAAARRARGMRCRVVHDPRHGERDRGYGNQLDALSVAGAQGKNVTSAPRSATSAIAGRFTLGDSS